VGSGIFTDIKAAIESAQNLANKVRGEKQRRSVYLKQIDGSRLAICMTRPKVFMMVVKPSKIPWSSLSIAKDANHAGEPALWEEGR